MAAIFKMAAIKNSLSQFVFLNFTELTDLYDFGVKIYVYELIESDFSYIFIVFFIFQGILSKISKKNVCRV